MSKNELAIASENEGKITEIREALKGLPLVINGQKDVAPGLKTSEAGQSFKENALIKARALHQRVGGWVLADDSGLECEDLHWMPGIHSARFAGAGATDKENNAKLVEELSAVHDPTRIARYVCVLALISPGGEEKIFDGACNGMVTFQPGGKGGFGYDPYFFLPEYGRTMAEMPLPEKNRISHRGKALVKLRHYLHVALADNQG